jgi:spore germination protein GerM
MTLTDRPDDDLRALVRDAVSDVHPAPALDQILRRTTTTAPRRGRTWLAVSAAAAAVAVIAGGITLANRPVTPPEPAGQAGPPMGGTPTALPPSTGGPTTGTVQRALAVYFVGDTPQGPRLYREFQRASVAPLEPPILAAVSRALTAPVDPDYRTPWPAGTRVGSTSRAADGVVTVSLVDTGTLGERPAAMSADEADEAVQQLVYTVQATVQDRRPVRFQLDGKDVDTLLGVDVSSPVPAQPQLDVLALVNITEPAEGTQVRGSFTAHGVASSFEATVPWEITQGGTVVKQGFSTADGWIGKLYPWATGPIDVSDLAPGTYTFTASTDDPSGGEGLGPDHDTRTIVVRR